MPKRSSKRASRPSANPTAESGQGSPARKQSEPDKNPHAVALGRLGGLKGGKARAAKLSKARRSEIARKAAETRWRNR